MRLLWQLAAIGIVAASGSKTLTLNVITTFTVTATNAGGSSSASVTVTVRNAPSIQSFSANPAKIVRRYDSTILSWSTTDADVVTIAGIGRVPMNGSIQLTPTWTTTYILVAASADGRRQASKQITVEVNYPPLFGQ
jgi:hypothetical protein